MPIAAAYLAMILIWTTTPLAIKWSGEGPGWLFGVTSRMLIGAACVWILLRLRHERVPLDPRAHRHYAAGALGIYGAMMLCYCGAQYVPSGWVSVMFGLAPLMTAGLSRMLLGERLNTLQLLALSLAVAGLARVFGDALKLERGAVLGVTLLLFAAFIHALSGVLIKRIDYRMPALASVGGSMGYALPLYFASWFLFDGHWPDHIGAPALWSILYLGVVATTAGFTLYYQLLRELSATRVALINLITPVFALLAGHAFNDEIPGTEVMLGTGLILAGLLLHESARRSPA